MSGELVAVLGILGCDVGLGGGLTTASSWVSSLSVLSISCCLGRAFSDGPGDNPKC